jgi:hypothetical protein
MRTAAATTTFSNFLQFAAQRFELSEADRINLPDPDTLLAVDEALALLATEDAQVADVAD